MRHISITSTPMASLALWLLAIGAASPEAPALSADSVHQVLNEFHVGEVRSAAAVERIGKLGSDAVPDVVDALGRRTFPGPGDDGDTIPRPIGEAHEGVLMQGLAKLPFDAVRSELDGLLSEGARATERILAARILAHTGPPADLPWLAEILDDQQPASLRSFRAPMEGLTATWLSRDPRALAKVPAYLDAVNPRLLRSALAGIRDSGSSSEVLNALARCLGRGASVDALILVEIGGEARTTRRPVAPETLSLVRPFLGASDRRVRLEAVLAAGHLDDVEAIPELIAMLAGRDESLRSRAKQALERASRESLGADHGVWDRWYRGAETWRASTLSPLLSRLRGTDPVASRRALLEIARYRVFRYDLVGQVASALQDADDGTAEIACAVLGHFACEDGLPALVDALGHPSVDVRKAALQALRRATGQAIGEDPAAWRAAGFGVERKSPR